MATQCPACSKTNPANANYCYYDGRPLSQGGADGPLKIGAIPFPMPFCFADGQSCANFNQLALACDERWDEARGLLAEGVWSNFFSVIGRLDLATAAKQAAKEPDRDVGLSHLLEKFPADQNALRLPKLALSSSEEVLGPLKPGVDHKFELRITNQGMLVLRGMVTSDSDWLSFGDPATSASLKMFQTRNICTVPVRVLGSKLRAGKKSLKGKIVVDTNGGAVTLPVKVTVPIMPFPKGTHANNVLAGAVSPHEIAVRAKAHPQEAALLFEQGAVKAWYASNGWIYPVEGTQASGKGAVQQFFEALGLTKPPPLELSVDKIVCKGKPGQKLTKKVTLSTKESRAVYAQAWSTQEWIKAEPGKPQGNTVTVSIQIEVPARPGETLTADVNIQGNGKQRFVVPVKLTVEAGSINRPAAEAPRPATGAVPRTWIYAGAGLALLIVVGVVAFIASRPGDDPKPPPIAIGIDPKPPIPPEPPPPPPPAKKNEAWWDNLADRSLTTSMAALQQSAPQHRELFESMAALSDVDRHKAYETLASKIPELTRQAKVSATLGRAVTDCLAFEPSELNVSPLRRGLLAQIPADGAEFRPEEKGDDLERAFWSLRVGFDAVTHSKIAPERARALANDLGGVFGFSLETGAPPRELEEQSKKLLVLRCYRNTLPTATKSLEHALSIRERLIEKFPEQISPAFRGKIDVDLLASALPKEKDAWPKLAQILQGCLEGNDLGTQMKIVGLYHQASPEMASHMEEILAAKWKAVADPKRTQADKAAFMQKSLVGAAARAKITPAERIAQLKKLTSDSLTPAKASKKDAALFQETIRLAHAAAMACDLFHPEIGLERFDEFATKVPEIQQTDAEKAAEAKPEKAPPKQPDPQGTVVGPQPVTVQGQLTAASERDERGNYTKRHLFTLKAGQVYQIDMMSNVIDSYLKLEDPRGTPLAMDDDGGAGFNARIFFQAAVDGPHRVFASAIGARKTGAYTLQIREGAGGFGFGFGLFGGRGFMPGMVGPGFNPNAPKVEVKNDKQANDKQVNPADIADLENKQGKIRLSAFNSIAENKNAELTQRQAQKIANYLLVTIQQSELEEAQPKLESFAKSRPLMLALADNVGNGNLTIAQKTMETVGSGVLGRPLQFARDEDWRSACRKLLLERALELTGRAHTSATQTADILRDLYKEQGLAFGIESPEFHALAQPNQVLEGLIKHVAVKVGSPDLGASEKELLEQMERQLQAARFVADNDLENMVLLQRIWLEVLTMYLQKQSPVQAAAMREVRDGLAAQDRRAGGVLEQLRAGEEAALRVWALAHKLD